VDETVADFARRRLGQEALDKLLDPMVTGIFCGDPEAMSLASCFPVIRDLERKHGGLFKGMLAVARERKAAGRKAEMSAGPGGVLTSFDEGVETLVSVLADRLRPALQLGVAVERIERKGKGYLLSLLDRGRKEKAEVDEVVLSVPAYAAREMVSALDGELAQALGEIPYAPIAVVALGFNQATLENPLDGFGFLTTRKDRRKVLGVLWDSSVFSNRAPRGKALIRAMVGGVRSPELAELPAEELIALTREEVAATMGVRAVPVLSRAFHHPLGIPQYNVGHGKILSRIDGRLAALPGVTLNSNAYRGISLNDCVRESLAAARRIARGTGRPPL
jgi:oxygen-dependent protoporphyrinogen oxidase